MATALPEHRYEQRDLVELARTLSPDLAVKEAVLARFFEHVGVRHRHLALSGDGYKKLTGFGSRNEAWLAVAQRIGEHAIRAALDRAHLRAQDVGLFMTTTVTGLAVPSLDARLMNRLPFSDHTKRVPLFGLGCVAGVSGLARAAEYLRAFPTEAAILLSVELCSLTVQKSDSSVANAISMGLFGDGAAAVVLVGAEHPSAKLGPAVLGSRAAFFPDTQRVMGWDIVDDGFKVVLGPEVPSLAARHLPGLVDGLLDEHWLERSDISDWLAHPGGPAVIDAMCRALELPAAALDRTRKSLAEVGNLSSASVLFVLDAYLRERQSKPDRALMLAMGPGFCAEAALLEW